MSTDTSSALVSSEWLAQHLTDPTIKILDCTWHHPSTNLDGRTQYRGRHLPGSVHFDIDQVADKSNPLPHMLPTAEDFAHKVGLLGISNSDRVIVYDRHYGGSAAARVWWMFRVFGHDNVALLDGGFGKWTKEKRPAEMTPVRPAPASFTANVQPGLVATLADVQRLAQSGAQLVDARGPGKFDGTQADVFAFKRQGHIPGAINLPWADLVDPDTGVLLSPDALTARVTAAGINLGKTIVTTCASGITSCMLALALYQLGAPTTAVYDGSWAEWSQLDDTAVAA
ncbi:MULTISPECIES: sulfurtransferase [Bradyrhizobium]|jgi:thiosulfate/3-mercaptopyruvate sulfurtransferase|uniref:Sulfurtransferase n=3 Tax=Bradyrhizobium TaxID=374 RepID=A0ABS5G8T5_9BRAD|nr:MULTISPECIES: sulfurtransferase [Bradyrhizobium]RTL95931.1 MAG: sulfurtransferase [Bradyrhizobiaceae bacterium]MBR1137439.1 sulfurtransferase [Bradyrhizobium denitrificans]MCL8488186.1 sulfurtransferase [Bradyrhizobium denitrificans]MDU1497757.1 sulfurtransferase [Bradyrhizobium sp.]MDU1548035.1 sulfurtransferase [Bradyrhizobium sp.]